MSLGKYSKFAVAVGGVFSVVGQILSDGTVSTSEIGILASAIAAAVLVFVVPNAKGSEAS